MAQPDVSLCRAGTETEQLQKRQRSELVLAVTLPFKRQDVSQNLFELAIDQTRKRWAWFTKSRELELGTELGTLVYLPGKYASRYSRRYSMVYVIIRS